jgi:hypothetical protein
MQKSTTLPTSKPRLKDRPQHPAILSIIPKPPTVHREVPAPLRDKNPLTDPDVRGKKSLHDAIDYAKLTASQQARWDAGLYGSIELKKIKSNYYFYLRWRDPETGAKRSSYLGKEWEQAIAKLQKLTLAQ